MGSLSLSWSLGVRSLSWSLAVKSLSMSWSLGVRSLLTSLKKSILYISMTLLCSANVHVGLLKPQTTWLSSLIFRLQLLLCIFVSSNLFRWITTNPSAILVPFQRGDLFNQNIEQD